MEPRRHYVFGSVALLGALLLFVPGVPRLLACAVMLLPFVALAVWRRIDPPAPPQRVIVDGEGVTRELRGAKTERVAWADLVHVSIMTTADGPFGDDFFWMLAGQDGKGCAVPSTLAVGLLERLQRLPRFNNESVIRASGCTTVAGFDCWDGKPGEALVAAEPLAEKA